ncbi:MAG: 1-phosphofructokinase family hexose kinase [Thermoleophilia bacterium]|jgi:1-phosphofructokinase family hexose kinase|nr:1-phosphofructokinase family hexose kinase [Thermoleophilia bacterium]
MITTVTLNTAMDRALVVPNFLVGRRHRASSGVTLPGGKGITIARALRHLGSPVIATGMAGGLTGSNIVERLTDEGILNDFVRIVEPSRTSTAVIDPVTGVHTEINEYGPRVRESEVDLLLEKLRYLARASTCMVLAGSLPRDVQPDIYQRILRGLQSHRIFTVVTQPDDTEALRLALQGEPSLTVIEQREAEDLAGNEFASDEDFVIAIENMARMGGQTIVVMHATGCVARVKQGRTITWLAADFDLVEAVSQLGFTDCFVAGALHATFADRPLEERLSMAIGTALANQRVLGAGVFEKGDAVRLQKEVRVRTLEPVELEVD